MITPEEMRERYENGLNKAMVETLKSFIDSILRRTKSPTNTLQISVQPCKYNNNVQDEVARQMREIGYYVTINRGSQYNEPHCVWTIKW